MSDLLHLNYVLCALAFAGLVWRLVGRWSLSYTLGKVIVSLFTVLELIVAIATARRAALGGPFNEAQYAIMLHAVAVIALVVLWPWLLDRDPPKPHHPVHRRRRETVDG